MGCQCSQPIPDKVVNLEEKNKLNDNMENGDININLNDNEKDKINQSKNEDEVKEEVKKEIPNSQPNDTNIQKDNKDVVPLSTPNDNPSNTDNAINSNNNEQKKENNKENVNIDNQGENKDQIPAEVKEEKKEEILDEKKEENNNKPNNEVKPEENNNTNNREVKEEEKIENNNDIKIIELEKKEENNEEKKEEDNNNKENKENKEYDIGNYPKDVLELINMIRNNPPQFASEVEKGISKIKEIQGKLVYCDKLKVALNKGESIFREVIDILKNTPHLEPLQFNEKIVISCPTDEEEIKNPKTFQNKVIEKKKEINLDVYFKDAVQNPYISVLLIIVDDSNKNAGKKRNAILNPEFKQIGISSILVNKTFCAYYTLSK